MQAVRFDFAQRKALLLGYKLNGIGIKIEGVGVYRSGHVEILSLRSFCTQGIRTLQPLKGRIY